MPRMGVHLITGGAGFIGSHLAEALLSQGRRVRVLDDFSTGRAGNLGTAAGAGPEIRSGTVCDADAVRSAMEGVEVAYHLAAMASVPRSVADPVGCHRVNVDGTLNVLLAARDAGVRRVVFSGSSSAYGDDPAPLKHEDLPTRPISPYAAAKLAGEHYCRAFSAVYGLDTVVLRYFNVFGPRQDPAGPYAAAVPVFLTAMLAGRAPVVFGDGGQSRDFTYVDNVVSANRLAADAPGPFAGEAFNIAAGGAVTLLEVIDRLNALLGTAIRPEHRPARAGDIRHSAADITRARDRLGYRPAVGFAEGLARTVDWFRRNAAGSSGDSR